MLIDRTEIFDAHERQGKPTSLIDLMRSVELDEHRIDRAGYRTEVALDHKRIVRTKAIRSFVVEIRRLQAARIESGAAKLEAYDAERATASTAARSVTVDMASLHAAVSPAEIGLVVREAIASGDAVSVHATFRHAEPELRRRALQEQRERKLPSSNSAFNWLVTLQGEVAAFSVRRPARHVVAAEQQAAVDAIERHALEIAAVLGLDQAVKAELTRETVSTQSTTASGLVFGSFWER